MRRGCEILVVVLLLMSSTLAPALASAGSRAADVTAGPGHTCVVTTGGGVKCWGANSEGQLGDATTIERTVPTEVSDLTTGVAAVAAGGYHTCALTTGGGVKCWGRNYEGELGDGTTTFTSTPTDVVGLSSGVATVVAGSYHTCAVTMSGGVKCWGYNLYGQLGDGTTTDRATPTDVLGLTSGVAAVAAGDFYTCAVTTGGAVKCWGDNAYGQLGDGTTTQRTTPTDVSGLASGVTVVAAGYAHTCAVTTGGGVKCWGWNSYGQLGDGTGTDRTTPTDVTGQPSGVVEVSAGWAHTCALTSGGGVTCWGDNLNGQLGDGTIGYRATPKEVTGLTSGVATVASGNGHNCALTTGGGVKCWGYNGHGQLGTGTTTLRTTPTDVTGLASGVAALVAGGEHTCAVTTGGGVKCWGDNYYSQLGDGTTNLRPTPTDVTGLTGGVAMMAATNYHTCALTTSGGLKCWGSNSYGQVGDGTGTVRTTPTDVSGLTSGVAAVAAGAHHTCALTTSGGLKCWGYNSYGQLGDGTTTDRMTPTDVSGLTSGVTAVAAGGLHTCAVTAAGGVKCWGWNEHGQLGDGTTTDRTTPTDVPGLSSGVVTLAAGYWYTCALTTGGGVKCWGDNSYGQLGDSTTTERTTPTDVTGLANGVLAITASSSHSCAVTTGGAVKCWGNNGTGELGDGTTAYRTAPTDVPGLTSGVAAVAAGGYHTCALTAGGGVTCWGWNAHGQLGAGAFAPVLTPVRLRGFGQVDFDSDDVADIAVYRPSTGTWFSLDSSTNNNSYRYRGWGMEAQGDIPAPGDYDGDGVVDPTVYRPQYGTWFILESHSDFTTWRWFGWGNATDTPVPGDYDGDGTTDAAVYRVATGTWWVRPSNGAPGWSVVFGTAGDVPIPGDFDGDGKRDPAVYRPSTGTWFWLLTSSNLTQYDHRGWGLQAQGDAPVPGDYDGDGKTDLCVFRPETGTWFILESSADYTTWWWVGWGETSDLPVAGDYDGDGRTDAAVYRPVTWEWFVHPSGGPSPWTLVFGQGGDLPLLVW